LPADKFFPYAANLMKTHRPHITDWSQTERIRRFLGIEPGKARTAPHTPVLARPTTARAQRAAAAQRTRGPARRAEQLRASAHRPRPRSSASPHTAPVRFHFSHFGPKPCPLHSAHPAGQPQGFDWKSASPQVQGALTRATKTGLDTITAKVPTIAPIINGWQMNTNTMGVYGNCERDARGVGGGVGGFGIWRAGARGGHPGLRTCPKRRLSVVVGQGRHCRLLA
jgi:hypothetical protein